MKSLFIAATMLMSLGAFAQDMSDRETIEEAYRENADGSSTYIGSCTTHEDYLNSYFKVTKTIQDTVEPQDMSEKEIKTMIKKLGANLIENMLSDLDMDDLSDEEESTVEKVQNYVDDLTVEKIANNIFPKLNLIRLNVGYGGGNGGFLVYEVNEKTNSLKLMSKTGDGDLEFCDKKVWLTK